MSFRPRHARAAQSHAASQWPTRRLPLDLLNRRARRVAPATTEKPATAAAAAAPPPLSGDGLVAWCRAQGAAVHPAVELVYENGRSSSSTTVRTLRVSAAVRAGEHLAVVPARLCVGDAAAAPPPPSQQQQPQPQPLRALLDACPPDGRWQWRSAVALLHHALSGEGDDDDDESPLTTGYLPHLPGRAPGVPLPQVPLLWSSAELRELQGCCPRAAAAAAAGGEDDPSERRRAFARDHLAAKGSPVRPALEREARAAGEASPVDAGERLLAWALAVVTSRSFGMGASGHVMVPLVDMADHRPSDDPGRNAEVRAFSPDDDDNNGGDGGSPSSSSSMAVVLRASRDIAPGEAVAICYGDHGPADTLLSYGFVLSPPAPAPATAAATAAAAAATPTIGPPCHTAWDPDLLLAAFEALVSGAGPGVTQARDLQGWQRRALDALFSRDEAAAVAAAAKGEGEAAATAEVAAGGDRQEPPPSKRKKSGAGRGSSGGFGAPGAKASAAERKAAAAAPTAAAAAAAAVRLGGDAQHTVDARLAGAARLLALTKQDPGVAAAVRALAEGGQAGLAALCAPMPCGGGGGFPVSAAHEAVAARALSGYTALVYKRSFRTTIQEDERLLRVVREEEERAAKADGEAASAPPPPPPPVGRATARDRRERRELALRFRLSAKRELERVAQALSAHMRIALEGA